MDPQAFADIIRQAQESLPAVTALDYGPAGVAVAMLLLIVRFLRNGVPRGGDNPGHYEEIIGYLRRAEEGRTSAILRITDTLDAIRRDLAIILDRLDRFPR